MATTREILDHHLSAFFAYDVEGVLSDYGKDIVFFTADGPLNGVDAVRPVFETLIDEFRQPGSSFNLTKYFVEGGHGYILWSAETSANVYDMATDTFVVRDGRIVAQSFTASARPKRDLSHVSQEIPAIGRGSAPLHDHKENIVMIDEKFATQFVSDWIDSWNSHDLGRILSHYVDDFEMSSPLIVEMEGEPSGTLKGKSAVGAYWAKALAKFPGLHFDHVATFIGVNSITLNFRWGGGQAMEVFLFGADRRVIRAYAHHTS